MTDKTTDVTGATEAAAPTPRAHNAGGGGAAAGGSKRFSAKRILLTAYIHEANIPDLVRHWRATAAITPCRYCRRQKRMSFGNSSLLPAWRVPI